MGVRPSLRTPSTSLVNCRTICRTKASSGCGVDPITRTRREHGSITKPCSRSPALAELCRASRLSPRAQARDGVRDRVRSRSARTRASNSGCTCRIRISIYPLGRLGVGGRERERGGTQTSGQCSPSSTAVGGGVDGTRAEGGQMSERGMSLIASGLPGEGRAAFCAALEAAGEVSVRGAKQPGRERPPAAAPDPGPALGARGVAHAPAACPSRPDTRTSARVIDPTPCRTQSWPPARRAPRLETVTIVASTFVKERASCH